MKKENKILTSYVKKILESKDFNRCYSALEKNAINKSREGLFAIVKDRNSDKYIFTPELYLGSSGRVSRKEGVKYAQKILGEKYKGKSLHSLVKSEEFLEDCKKNDLPFGVNFENISKKHNWNENLKDSKNGFAGDYLPLIDIHNHPKKNFTDLGNELFFGNAIVPSEEDLRRGFILAKLGEEESLPFYSLIFGDKPLYSGEMPFSVLKFEKIPQYTEFSWDFMDQLRKDMKNETREINGSRINFYERKLDTKEKGFDWKHFLYNPKNRKVKDF